MSQEAHGRVAVEHRFGPYGGQYVPETLMPALAELELAWSEAREDPGYLGELELLLRDYGGRPTPLYLAPASPSGSVGASISSARTSTTPARTSSTTPSARCCWPDGWASTG